MLKEKINLKIEKNKFLIITPSELDSFMLVNEFSEKTINQITSICKKFKDAYAILFFLNKINRNYSLDCFIPLCNNRAVFDKFRTIQEIDGAICCPIMLSKPLINLNKNEIEAIFNKAINKGGWMQEYGFGIQKDNMSLVQIDMLTDTVERVIDANQQRMKINTEGTILRMPEIKKTAVKKASIKKNWAKKPVAKKAVAKKPAAKKTSAKKTAAKKAAAKKSCK